MGNQSTAGSSPAAASDAATVGNRSPKDSRPGGVEPQVPHALRRHAVGHGPAHDVARGELVDEPLALGVAQQRPVAPQRLGQQGPGHGGMVQRRRVELEELEVGHRHPGPQGHGDPVPGGLGRVGRHRVELARAPRGQHHLAWPAPPGTCRRGRGPATPTHRPPSTMRSSGEPLLEDRRRAAAHRRRRAPARPRPRWPHPRRAGRGPWSARLPGPGRDRLRPRGRTPHRGRSARRHDRAPRRRAPARRRRRTVPAPAASVSARWRSVESSSPPTAAAIPPWAQRVVDWARSALVSTPTRSPAGVARRTTADRPATPEPRTRTSSFTGRAPERGPGAGLSP